MSEPARDPVNDMRQWRAAIARHELYDELVLWFEHDLFDQLNLIQLLAWIHARLPEGKPVSLICINAFPGRPHFKGLGELTAEELGPLIGTRQPVGRAQFELARRAWDAFRDPAPETLDRLRREDSTPLPYLAAAIARFLQDYPWTCDGLSRTERRLFELASGGPIPLRKAFPACRRENRRSTSRTCRSRGWLKRSHERLHPSWRSTCRPARTGGRSTAA